MFDDPEVIATVRRWVEKAEGVAQQILSQDARPDCADGTHGSG
jgi:hypothetical protein